MKKLIILFSIIPMTLTGCSAGNGIPFFVNDNEFETLYDDSYFLLDNKEYHQEIALASFASSMASIDDNTDYTKRGDNLIALLEKEKFTNIYLNKEYKEKPTLDSVAYGIASKRINDFNLIALTVRSGGYDAEWASNFTVGDSGNASGFENSAYVVLEGLYEYINTYNFSGHTKLWLSGYSRGGSINNILSGMILNLISQDSFISKIETSLDDVYSYCFEPQNVVGLPLEEVRSELYYPIHNVLNFNDIVAMVFPNSWGLYRYGQNHFYSDRLTDINFDAKERVTMVKDYHYSKNAQNYADYKVDEWKFYDAGAPIHEEYIYPRESLHPSLGRFSHHFIDLLSTNLERYIYYYLEEGFRNIFGTIYGYNPDVEGIDISDSIFFDILFSYSFIQSLFSKVQEKDYLGFAYDIEFIFYILFDANENNIEAIQKLYDDIFYFFIYAVPSLSLRPDITNQLFSRDNLMILASTHATELNYSFLRSADPRINGDNACHLNDGTYQILHIENPTSISIYEKTLQKNVFSYEDGQMSSEILSAEKYTNGTIDIYMPKNGQYEYQIEADDISLINVDDYNIQTIINSIMPKTGTF